MPLSALILAGGRSRRMGTDKALLRFGGATLIEHVVRQIQPRCDELLLSVGTSDRYDFLGLPTLRDPVPEQGPLRGIAEGLRSARHERLLVLACDLVQVPLALVARIEYAVAGHDAAVPKTAEGYWEPLFAIYTKGCLDVIDRHLDRGELCAFGYYGELDVAVVPLAPGESLTNLNSLADLEACEPLPD